MTRYIFFHILVCVLLASCGQPTEPQYGTITDTLYTPRYAERFEIYQSTKGVVIKSQVYNSSSGVYTLITDEDVASSSNFVAISNDIDRVAVMSTSYIAFLSELDKTQTICGVSGTDYVSNPQVLEMVEQKKVSDIGIEGAINYEVLASIKPDVLLSYGLSGENASTASKLIEMGIPSVPICDYLEQSPLGRAEWMVAVGAIMGCTERAEKIFGDIELRYNSLKDKVKGLDKPTVMFNIPWRDVWYIPSPDNYTVRLIDDAGGQYICDDNDQKWGEGFSKSISSEQGYLWVNSCDVWLNMNAVKTKAELLATNANFASTLPFKKGRMYNNNLRESPKGGSDFWENGVVNPDVVLADLIYILHPELMPEHKLYYYRHIK